MKQGTAARPLDTIFNSIAPAHQTPNTARVSCSTAKPVISVQVRALVDFALRTGDLGSDRDFVARDRALAGTRGHQQIQRARPAGYAKEVKVSFDVDGGEFTLRIQGRIDGVLRTPEGVVLEEIKTVEGRWDGLADPLHWAQAKVYAFIYATDEKLESLQVRLVYLHLETGEVTEFVEAVDLTNLREFFDTACTVYLEWVRERFHWSKLRDQSIRALEFPFREYRPGQREAAVAVYRAIVQGRRLFLEAPTGIGKTISVLYPSVKALAEGKIDRIFYLTARTTGRAIAEKAFSDLAGAQLRLKSLTLTARDKICVRSDGPCDIQSCPLARGYYDRRRSAMRQALTQDALTRPVIEAVAAQHQVCPFELALDLSSWVEAIICDYNHVFDPAAYLRRHFDDNRSNGVFLIDEAHNLVDRAREMFSADVDAAVIRNVKRAVQTELPGCAKALGKVLSSMRALAKAELRTDETPLEPEPGWLPLDTSHSNSTEPAKSRPEFLGASAKLPEELLAAVEKALDAAELWLARNEQTSFRRELLDLYFYLNAFWRAAQSYDERFRTLVEGGARLRVRLCCLDPSFLLSQALQRGQAAVFFSATLSPPEYYQRILGGNLEDPVLQLASPFPLENLAVLVHEGIRTQFSARAASRPEVVQSIAGAVQGRRGNYLVYFPSYEYLRAVHESFTRDFPKIRTLVQQPGMTDDERAQFLEAFSAENAETLVGFAVLGGVFGEGIDLVGERLVGAVVVGVGLPQLNSGRNLIRAYFDEQMGTGFEFAYTYPGMNRVLQAIGRVIRSETDRGAVLLIDARFREKRYQRLFPAWWRPVRVRAAQELRDALEQFWV